MKSLNTDENSLKKDNFNEDNNRHKPTPMMVINEISKLMSDKIRLDRDESIMQRSNRLLMRALAQKDGITQLDLAKITHLKAPTVSVTLQKMEKDGIVTRRPDKDDLRAMRVYITDKGKEINRNIILRILKEEKDIMQGITEKEAEILLEILFKMRNNFMKKDFMTEKEG